MFAADVATTAQLAFAIRHSSGLVHAAMPSFLLDKLRIPDQPVFASEDSRLSFTVAVDAANGIGTGISAHDRARTLRVLADGSSVPDDLVRPGHVMPVRCDDGGYRSRRRCWELAVEQVTAQGHAPVAVAVRLVDESGDILDPAAAFSFGVTHGISVSDVRESSY